MLLVRWEEGEEGLWFIDRGEEWKRGGVVGTGNEVAETSLDKP